MWIGLGWVGLDLCDGLGCIDFFLTHYDELGLKISLIQPDLTHTQPIHAPTCNRHIKSPTSQIILCYFVKIDPHEPLVVIY